MIVETSYSKGIYISNQQRLTRALIRRAASSSGTSSGEESYEVLISWTLDISADTIRFLVQLHFPQLPWFANASILNKHFL